ncbi:MAG TPA: SCP2 sterol-binding domain-containing protein [Acidimicrobiia bacterium]
MSVKFLSDEYIAAGTDALHGHADFMEAAGGVDLTVQFMVTGGPDGEVTYHLDTTGGATGLVPGPHAQPDVTITSGYDTAVSLSKGDLNTQMAFMTGKIKVAGNMAVLLLNQTLINEFARALGSIDVEY